MSPPQHESITREEALRVFNKKITNILIHTVRVQSVGNTFNGGFSEESIAFFNTFSTFYALLLYSSTPDYIHAQRNNCDITAIRELRTLWKDFLKKAHSLHCDLSYDETLFGDLEWTEMERMLDQAFDPGMDPSPTIAN
jgi:hypothetical protein